MIADEWIMGVAFFITFQLFVLFPCIFLNQNYRNKHFKFF